MWTFEMLVTLNTANFFVSLMAENYLIRKVADIENTSKHFWVAYVGFAILTAAIASWLTLPEIISNGNFDYGVAMLFFDSVNIAATIWLHALLLPGVSKRIIFFFGVLSGILFNVLGETYSGVGFWILDGHVLTSIERVLFHSIRASLLLIIMWQIYRLVSKSKIIYIARKAFLYPKATLVISLLVFFQQVIVIKILEITNLESSPFYYILYVSSYLAMFAFSMFLIREYVREERLKRSEILLAQQKSYMEHLETVQQDLRKIHHDYKNVAAGLYTQVEAGDLAAAQEYISKEFLQLDQGLELSLQQHNQLLNVELLELKTLFMAKILQAEKMKVRLTIEVMEPVRHISMEIADLLRCGGILLDNAIEAAVKTEEKEVCVVLLKEKDTLTLIVKNTVDHPVDLQRIWEAGYSTKGDSRGLGLANLKEILQRYNHVVLETRVQENWFNQVLFFQK